MTVTTDTATTRLKNYVGGEWVDAGGAEFHDVINPATGDIIAEVPYSTANHLDEAVRAARQALPAWRGVSTIARARMLFTLREKLQARKDEIARSVVIEMGKTLPDATAEVGRMIEMVEAATAIPTTMQGKVLEDVARGVDAETIRQPVGVCGIIAPFNFPAMVPFWFLPFAIACGNTVILKPSEQVPMTQQMVFGVINELDLPAGVVNLVNGSREVVEGMLDHPDIDAISFVGSAPVAKLVYERAAQTGKRVQALGGAKNHMVICPDAVVEPTVNGLIGSGFGAAGQRCMAGSVIVTVGEGHDRVVPALIEASRKLIVGDGLDEGVDVGPVISCASRDRINDWIDQAIRDGAEIVVDGRDPEGANPEGSYVGPTILDNVSKDDPIVREEVFGPVLAIVNVDTLEEAIEVVNSSPFGNGVSIFTESASAVRKFRHDVEVGMVGVNIGVAAPVAFFPFSGWKASFLGDLHAHGPDGVEFFTRKKTITSRYFSGGHESGSYFVER
ncbi:MAG TPA: CoA-acylating methylmalonate-semialdehyde dehydrogenase [Solirubrobacterales bacterium]|nr:CoA-acylating methylmalonate-semialdehyde dehydrogenase [Solirubrobacterales bacterium]